MFMIAKTLFVIAKNPSVIKPKFVIYTVEYPPNRVKQGLSYV